MTAGKHRRAWTNGLAPEYIIPISPKHNRFVSITKFDRLRS